MLRVLCRHCVLQISSNKETRLNCVCVFAKFIKYTHLHRSQVRKFIDVASQLCFDDGKNLIKPRVRVFGFCIGLYIWRAIHRVYVRCAFVGFQCSACAPLPNTPPKENAHGKKIRARRIADVLYTPTVYRALEIYIYLYVQIIMCISNRTSCYRTY